MRQIADDVVQIALTPRDGINAYLVGDTLVDAGLPMHGKKLAKELAGQVQRHVLTHAHGDHAGGSKAVTEGLGVPLLVGVKDAPAARSGVPETKMGAFGRMTAGFPAVPVDEELKEGDTIGDFLVLDTPGHSPGHISLWRERDRVLIAGDVFFNMNIFTTIAGLRQPFGPFTLDPELNRQSERKVAELEPDIVALGHGPVITGAAPKLKAFVAAL
ncbi:MAG: MBL fold metallo-hydrolase [Solirubrobacteraceae bacterium]|nr:MBL fold metallo-hydrolase [Solirubrobacteraceae bacterium]